MLLMPTKDPSSALLPALHFAAQKHSRQRRKDSEASPYINHPIAVAEVMCRIGGITDLLRLQSAILHDTIEDTETTPEELEERFGPTVRLIVQELTDNTARQPAEWPLQRKLEYLDWAEKVISGCRDCSQSLAQHFDARIKESR